MTQIQFKALSSPLLCPLLCPVSQSGLTDFFPLKRPQVKIASWGPSVARHGLRIFRGKGDCAACHVGPTLTDETFHNTGVAWQDGTLA